MTRPKDYGDQYPSDSGDQKPDDPIDNIDALPEYSPLGSQYTDSDIAEHRSVFNPVNELYIPNKHVRVTWAGIINELVSKEDGIHLYSVYRQDGLTINATIYHAEDIEWMYTGTTVLITAGEGAGEYTIIGHIQSNKQVFWAKLKENLLSNKQADAYLYYFDKASLSWETVQAEVKLVNRSSQTWNTGDFVQVRSLYDGSNPNDPEHDDMYFEPIVSGDATLDIVHFELTEDKGTADVAKLARLVQSDGTIDMASDDFYVLDNSNRFYGKAAWVNTSFSDRGYRGYAESYTEDYNETGKAGYSIIEMEQPVMGYLAKLIEDTPVTDPKIYDVQTPSIVQLEQQGEGRDPKALVAATIQFQATDIKGITDGGTIESALIIWSISEEKYIVASVLVTEEAPKDAIALINITVPAATIDYGNLTAEPGIIDDGAVIMEWTSATALAAAQEDDPDYTPPAPPEPPTPDQVAMLRKAVNTSMTPFDVDIDTPVLVTGVLKKVYGDEEKVFIIGNVMDMRAMPGFVQGTEGTAEDTQVVHHIGGATAFKLNGEECD